ncbi:signal transducing adapter molecule 1 [Drosophila mojavensis]|uniref:Signal transducing adapter molecule 1 n=1 Tax=Drosophila mojavensis TaxID=7230 RepID=B4KKL4_DROMO|nr:signal transducing adapter molecule 1 [Drosophila mojavensis]EDW12678.1 uncharacterized protein Dmoj_GI23591 [Drosophila mojavensis]
MGIFGQSSSFDADVEKATSETNTTDNWSLIMDVCDKVTTNPRLAKDCLKAVMRRMGHPDPHVVMQAITLLDACANNCGKPFHLEMASRDFETEFKRLLDKAQPKVALKMRQVFKNWVETYFKNDPELNLIPTLYLKLRLDGHDFRNLNDKSSDKSAAAKAAAATLAKDPNVVSSQQEEDDIAKAIELSLKETKSSPKQQQTGGAAAASTTSSAYPSLYPSFGGSTASTQSNGNGNASSGNASAAAASRTVRALYDFEAAEENELTFFSGEIIHVLDDSDANWWKGYNDRGEGLFPSNFVTADLSVDPERLDINQQHKNNAQKQAAAEEEEALLQQKTEAAAAQPVEIDEAKIDRLLHLLHEANPEDPSQDSDEMLRLEQQVHQMGPLIDAELERVDRKHAQLTQLSSDLVDAINLYHSLMRDDRAAAAQFGGTGFMSAGFPGAALYGAPGYPSAAGFPPGQSYPGMHSLPYAPPPGSNPATAPATTAAPPAAYPGQVPMPYQNGHPPQMNMLPPHLSQSPAVPPQSHPQPHPQPVYNAQPTPVTTQQQQPQPITNYPMPLPVEQQQQQPQQMPPSTLPQQFAGAPPTATQIQHQQPPPHGYMSPQHQQQQQQALPPQTYSAQPPQFYAPNGAPPVTQSYMAPPQQQQQQPQQQQQQQQPPQPQQQQQQQQPHNHNDHFSQLHQQMAAMSMAHLGGMPPAASGATPAYHMQNDAVKNNIPIYQQQR